MSLLLKIPFEDSKEREVPLFEYRWRRCTLRSVVQRKDLPEIIWAVVHDHPVWLKGLGMTLNV